MAKVLIVDDDKIFLNIATLSFQRDGHEVFTALDAYSALDIVFDKRIELVVTDINMPFGYSGFRFAQSLRKASEIKSLPIVFVSSRRDGESIHRALKAGGNDYFLKPVDFAHLIKKCEGLLAANRTTSLVKEKSVSEEIDLNGKANIFSISQIGLSLITRNPMPLNFQFAINSRILKDLGISTAEVRVYNCISLDKDKYIIKTCFVSLNNKDSKRILEWMNDSLLRTVI